MGNHGCTSNGGGMIIFTKHTTLVILILKKYSSAGNNINNANQIALHSILPTAEIIAQRSNFLCSFFWAI